MSAADEAGEARLASKALFAGGVALVAVGNVLSRRRDDDVDGRALDDGQEVRHAE